MNWRHWSSLSTIPIWTASNGSLVIIAPC